jgi:hypothetical protein
MDGSEFFFRIIQQTGELPDIVQIGFICGGANPAKEW